MSDTLDVPALQALLDRAARMLIERSEFLDDDPRDEMVDTADEISVFSSRLPSLLRDGERLDWLETEAKADPLLLHDERPGVSITRSAGGFRGLGLLGGARSLRQAIDAAMPPALSETTE